MKHRSRSRLPKPHWQIPLPLGRRRQWDATSGHVPARPSRAVPQEWPLELAGVSGASPAALSTGLSLAAPAKACPGFAAFPGELPQPRDAEQRVVSYGSRWVLSPFLPWLQLPRGHFHSQQRPTPRGNVTSAFICFPLLDLIY